MGVVFQKSALPTILHFARVRVAPLPHVERHLLFVCLFVCLFEWAPEVTNWYGNPQKWVVPWFGVQPQAQEQFYWSSSPPRCCWEVVWGGKGKTKRQEIDSCPKNPVLYRIWKKIKWMLHTPQEVWFDSVISSAGILIFIKLLCIQIGCLWLQSFINSISVG